MQDTVIHCARRPLSSRFQLGEISSSLLAHTAVDFTFIGGLDISAASQKRDFGSLIGMAVHAIDSVRYLEMMMREQNARPNAPDSGGMRDGAHFESAPRITLQKEIRWAKLGVNSLVCSEEAAIVRSLSGNTFRTGVSDICANGRSAHLGPVTIVGTD